MNCRQVRARFSELLDGRLSETERRLVASHLEECWSCAAACEQTRRLRETLRKLPALAPPPELTSALLVMASRERARQLAWRTPQALAGHLADRLRLWAENIMRPVALPVAGGLVSALILFSMLVPSVLFLRSPGKDVPLVGLVQEATVATPAPFGFEAGDFTLEVTVDRQGRMVDYSIAEGHRLIENPRLRRSIENYVLFTGFRPATAFGQPVYGKVTVSFRRYRFDVGS
ncbi:MAG: zf-HC2 domain-containing protein [Bryobacterales bacterium]|nr:zf-HC2 domain-containing protein [Bryobacteraceae bacterium]MDW8131566.1 zf-HC2 domain-containing protein [Bryobacterales bacterium]